MLAFFQLLRFLISCLTLFALTVPVTLTAVPRLSPPADGIECVKRYRAFEHTLAEQATTAGYPTRPPLRIIACSANDSDDLKEEVIVAGMDAFMAKPCTKAKLAQVMERIELDRECGAGRMQEMSAKEV